MTPDSPQPGNDPLPQPLGQGQQLNPLAPPTQASGGFPTANAPTPIAYSQMPTGKSRKKLFLIIAGVVLLIATAAIILVVVLGKDSADTATNKTEETEQSSSSGEENNSQTAPESSNPQPATPAALVPTEYDNGEGQKFSLSFFSGSTTVSSSSLSGSMNFIAGSKSKVLKENTTGSSKPAILLNIATSKDQASINGANSNSTAANCGTPVFTFTLNGVAAKVCDKGDPTFYTMSYVKNGTAYFVNVTNSNDTDLTSRNSELQQILSSIKPL